MQVIVNNESRETSATTLAALAAELSLPTRGVAVAIGDAIVPRTSWGETALTPGLVITVIRAACGG